MHDLAVRNQDDALTPAEKEEMHAFGKAGDPAFHPESQSPPHARHQAQNPHRRLTRRWMRHSRGWSGSGRNVAANTARCPRRPTTRPFEIDHIRSRKHHGPTIASNLALSCFRWKSQT